MDNPKKIIILHSDPLKRSRLKQLISESGHTPYCFDNITICLDNLNTLAPDLILIGPYPLNKTARFVNFLKTMDPGIPLLITGAGLAAREYVASNRFEEVRFESGDYSKRSVQRAIEALAQIERADADTNTALLVGNSPEMIKLRKLCAEISRSAETVLIQGEAGTGKDLVARTLHRWSNQKALPLIKINIAAFSANRVKVKTVSGADTDEINAGLSALDEILTTKPEGTLFLDGLEHMGPAFQAKIQSCLKLAGEGQSATEARSNTRRHIISATSTDIETLVETNQFNKDLFYGLSVFKIDIPPLRKHPEDIPLLIDYLADMHCRKSSNGICEIPENVKRQLREYNWPGNLGELESVVKKFIDSGFDERVFDSLGHSRMPARSRFTRPGSQLKTGIEARSLLDSGQEPISMKGICKQIVAKTEKKLIEEALQHNNWNRKKAARMLDISYRSLLNKIKEYRIV